MAAGIASGLHMTNVGGKPVVFRRAVAVGELHAGAEARRAIVERSLPKGDALLLAEVAGVQGAKQASERLPLCHPLALDYVRVYWTAAPDRHCIRMYCEVATHSRTGVEMEALSGLSSALLCLYDLVKPVDPALRIEGVRLLFKQGGKKGLWLHPDGLDDEERARFLPAAAADPAADAANSWG